jgi:hypothetical protein
MKLPTSLEYFAALKWIDGRPLLDTIDPYRRDLFTAAPTPCPRGGARASARYIASACRIVSHVHVVDAIALTDFL